MKNISKQLLFAVALSGGFVVQGNCAQPVVQVPLGWKALRAIIKGDLDQANALLDQGKDLDVQNVHGEGPLYIVIRDYENYEVKKLALVDMVEALIRLGFYVNACTQECYTPLHAAAWKGYLDVVRVLLRAGARINETTNFGETPLHLAAKYGYLDVVKELFSEGADINASAFGVTPLHYAASKGHRAVVKFLLDKSAKINTQTTCGSTPLHLAAKYGYLDVVSMLLNACPRNINVIDITDADEKTAQDLAQEKGHEEIVRLICCKQIAEAWQNCPLELCPLIAGYILLPEDFVKV